MKHRIKATLRLVIGVIALMAAHGAGVTSGRMLLARLTSDVDLRRKELLMERELLAESKDLKRQLARGSLKVAMLNARFAQIMRGAPSSDDLPLDRVRALNRRMGEADDRAYYLRLMGACRERARRGRRP